MRVALRLLSPRHVATCILVVAGCCVAPVRAPAQDSSGARATPRIGIGVGFGGGTISSAFHPTCFNRSDGRIAAGSADFRAGLHFGSLRLESTTAVRDAYTFSDCFQVVPLGSDGVETIRTTASDRGELVITDLRVGRTFGAGNSRWLLATGAGWVWTHSMPVVVLAGGLRLGGSVRFAMDWELSHYRTKWSQVTGEWHESVLVRELSRRHEYSWEPGFIFRLGIELEPGRLLGHHQR